jgi:hypothetical protein
MSYIGNQPQNTSFLSDTFSGNSVTTQFTMTVAPSNTAAVLVAIWGVLQDPTTYGVVGRILTFSQAPPTGAGNISVRYLALPASNITTTSYRSVTEFTATAGQTTFTPASYTPGFINVFRSGVRLGAANFTATNGVTVVLSNAAAAGDLITIESFFVSSVLNAIPNVAGAITPTLLDSTSQSGSGAIQIPVGTTAQRPAVPANGMIRKNTTTAALEFWDPTSSSWIGIAPFSATGGTITSVSGNTVHTFLSSANFTVLSGTRTVEYLIVAGGGGGGVLGGGGGGGGVLSGFTTVGVGSYSIVIGGGANGGAPGQPGATGGNTTALGFTALGGGGGGSHLGGGTSVSGTPGGSGGGASDNNNSFSFGAGTTGQGFRGGNGSAVFSNIPRGGGGGGGAAGVGVDINSGGAGGPGVLNAINGSNLFWAGGGGYGGFSGGSRGGDGGIGGGGGGSAANGASPAGTGGGSALNAGANGTVGDNVVGGAGGQNTGGGGGGGGWAVNATGTRSGGSGIVIIRYI